MTVHTRPERLADPDRRRFLRLLGAGASVGATAGVAGTAAAQDGPIVAMGNNYFDPIGLHVERGTTVRFEIEAGSHSATAYSDRIPDGAEAFDSGTISEGSFEHSFETPGTYDYYCIPHESVGMVGRIVVGEPGGPAEESPIPNGDVPDSETIVERGSVSYESFTGSEPGDDGRMGGHGGPGMMGGSGVGGLPFVGSALGILALAGGALYWSLRDDGHEAHEEDSAIATLRDRYERGEIDEAEFRRRRERLDGDREDGSR